MNEARLSFRTMNEEEPFEFTMNEEKDKLIHFLDKVKTLLESIVQSRWLLASKEMRDPIDEAWPEVKTTIDNMKSALDSLTPEVSEKLQQAGLSGKQLDLKLTGFKSTWNKLIQFGTKKWLKKVLDWINIILGSLLSAIPIGEPVKEFKEALEKEMGDNGDF